MEENQNNTVYATTVNAPVEQKDWRNEVAMYQEDNKAAEQVPEGDKEPERDMTADEVQQALDKELGVEKQPNESKEIAAKAEEKVEDLDWFEKDISFEDEQPKEEDWKKRYEETRSALDDLETDEFISLYKKHKSTEGFDFDKFVGSFKKNDYESVSTEDLFKSELKKQNLSEEDIEQEMEKFSALTILQKQSLRKQIVDGMPKSENEFLKTLDAARKKQEEQFIKEQESYAAAVQQLDKMSAKLVGQNIYGYELTKEVMDQIRKTFDDQSYNLNKDGSINVQRQLMDRIWGQLGPKILKAQVSKEVQQAKDELIDKRTRPSHNNASRGGIPVATDNRSKDNRDVDTYFENKGLQLNKN